MLSVPMIERDTRRATALNLHGLLAHWGEIASETLGHLTARLGGTGARPPQPGTAIAHCSYRPLQAAPRLRLGLAQALRPLRTGHFSTAASGEKRNSFL